jgi:hypothetical protein
VVVNAMIDAKELSPTDRGTPTAQRSVYLSLKVVSTRANPARRHLWRGAMRPMGRSSVRVFARFFEDGKRQEVHAGQVAVERDGRLAPRSVHRLLGKLRSRLLTLGCDQEQIEDMIVGLQQRLVERGLAGDAVDDRVVRAAPSRTGPEVRAMVEAALARAGKTALVG